MYGPVRTVVWQGSAGDRCPYADQTRKLDKYVSVPIYPPNAVLLFTMAVGTVRSVKTDWPFSVRPVRVLRRQSDLVCLPFNTPGIFDISQLP